MINYIDVFQVLDTHEIVEHKKYAQILPREMDNMIRVATDLFGEFDKRYRVSEIRIGPDSFPETNRFREFDLFIRLSLSCAKNEVQACHELAHEVIHLISPDKPYGATNLEEGVATYFSNYYMTNCYDGEGYYNKNYSWAPQNGYYKEVFDKVQPVIDSKKDCIKELRRKTFVLSEMSSELLSSVFPSEDAEFLAMIRT